MKKSIRLLTIIVWLFSAAAFSGTLQKTEVSRNADWIVHADYERFNQSGIGKLIRDELAAQGIEEKLDSFKTIFSFHPIDDVRDVTIYGRGQEKENAVALIDAQFDQEKLLALVRMNPKHHEIEYADMKLHRWLKEDNKNEKDNGQMMYGGILGGRLVVIGAGLDTVKQAVDVLKGSMENAAGRSLSLDTRSENGVFFQTMAADVGEIVDQHPQSAVLRKTDELSLTIGEREDKIFCSLGLSAKTVEAAQNVKKVLEGMIALGALAGEEQPKLEEFARHLQLSSQGKQVHLRFEADSQLVFDFLKEQWKLNQNQQDNKQ